MKRFLFVAGAAFLAGASAASAQQRVNNSGCPHGSVNALGIPDQARIAEDGCVQAYDFFQFMAPQLGISLTGGNATLGQGGTLGGLGHFTIGVRGNVVQGLLPDVANFQPGINGAQSRTLPTKDQILGLPTADAAIGIYKGFPLGLTNVGGVDLLLSADYIPKIDDSDVSITPDQNLSVGYGVRVGILQESIVVPGVSLTYLKRDLPKTDLIARSGNDTLSVTNMKVNTSAWRIVASKSLVLISIAAGVGQDTYDQSANFAATVNGTFSGVPVTGRTAVPNTSQTLKRTNFFADLSFNLPLFKIVGEIGNVSGGTVNTYNSFAGGNADRALVYYSAGLRFAF
jgi:hypothetical protein